MPKTKSKRVIKQKPKPKPKQKQKQKQKQIVNIRIGGEKASKEKKEEPRPAPVPTIITQQIPIAQPQPFSNDLMQLFSKVLDKSMQMPKELPTSFTTAREGENIPLLPLADTAKQAVKPISLYQDNVSDMADLPFLKGKAQEDDEPAKSKVLVEPWIQDLINKGIERTATPSSLNELTGKKEPKPEYEFRKTVELASASPTAAYPLLEVQPEEDIITVEPLKIRKIERRKSIKPEIQFEIKEPESESFMGLQEPIKETPTKRKADILRQEIMIMFPDKNQQSLMVNDFRRRYNIDNPLSKFTVSQAQTFLNELTGK